MRDTLRNPLARLGQEQIPTLLSRRDLLRRAGNGLGALGLATHADLDRVNQKIGRLRKRMEAILDRLE